MPFPPPIVTHHGRATCPPTCCSEFGCWLMLTRRGHSFHSFAAALLESSLSKLSVSYPDYHLEKLAAISLFSELLHLGVQGRLPDIAGVFNSYAFGAHEAGWSGQFSSMQELLLAILRFATTPPGSGSVQL